MQRPTMLDMIRRLFAERFAIESEPALLTEKPIYDEVRCYAVMADGSPAVEASEDDDVKTLTAVASEGVDISHTSMRLLAGREKTVTRIAAESPDEPVVLAAMTPSGFRNPRDNDRG